MWKWNLAFQCVVNIGVRGSEDVRRRVVEADMVPVIATILENYIRVTDKLRAKTGPSTREVQGTRSRPAANTGRGSVRRPSAPQYIDIGTGNHPPEGTGAHGHVHTHTHTQRAHTHRQQSTANNGALTVSQQPQMRSGLIEQLTAPGQPVAAPAPTPSIDPQMLFSQMPPVRGPDQLPSMGQAGSLPVSPTTPNPPTMGSAPVFPTTASRIVPPNGRLHRHQRSVSGESDEADPDDLPNAPATMMTAGTDAIVDVVVGQDSILEPGDAPMGLNGENEAESEQAETFNITHRAPINGSIGNTGTASPGLGFPQNPPATTLSLNGALPMNSRLVMDNSPAAILPSMPREEDVLMALQLLAYVSKYCNLRTYFQQSHLVPTLSIKKEMYLLELEDNPNARPPTPVKDEDEEYLLPDDYNIFPLVEKFTVRHHPADMQYWAGVVMRNLCRKDDSRNGIRQCAYYECGKWEQYTRQFAKCRRCRRTKYCSKECQKRAWVYHRHWCVAAQS